MEKSEIDSSDSFYSCQNTETWKSPREENKVAAVRRICDWALIPWGWVTGIHTSEYAQIT